ncbi:MAG: hypothetical protein HDR53_04945 [Treponema sp.]|nr:hypothetical protein [Treponema sp.]
MRVIVSGGGCYNGISVFQGDSGGVAGVFLGWRGRSARGDGDFKKVERDMQKEIL